MKININGKNINITEGMRTYLETKLRYFEKFLDVKDNETQEKVESVITASVSMRKNIQKLEIFFRYDNKEVKVKIEGPDFYINVNKAMDILKNKVGKLHSLKAKKSRESIKPTIKEEDTELPFKIVKKKVFNLMSMTVKEASLEMFALGYSSYIFKNSELDDSICLLYLRDDNDLGLIVTT